MQVSAPNFLIDELSATSEHGRNHTCYRDHS